ncbi:hypothetical protein SADUNF_Sadunf04G0003200 [Salix dunnii]|uniref:Uncharacterized protein n=1 Tax=Salix dunnii TaxID=1413687 RepID=A0A835KE40_9ROSI|nr:hypothetical protein SADUNF_Sadunf04G0003200 [Salix dunnii]
MNKKWTAEGHEYPSLHIFHVLGADLKNFEPELSVGRLAVLLLFPYVIHLARLYRKVDKKIYQFRARQCTGLQQSTDHMALGFALLFDRRTNLKDAPGVKLVEKDNGAKLMTTSLLHS